MAAWGWTGSVKVNTGRRWREVPVRVVATAAPGAARLAVALAVQEVRTWEHQNGKRVRVTGVWLRLERYPLGEIRQNRGPWR